MKKITANVFYPVYGVEVEVEDNATNQEIIGALFLTSDYLFETTQIRPLIQDCSIPQLNENNFNNENNK